MCNGKNGVLKHGYVKETTDKFNVSTRSVQRVWAAAREQMRQGIAVNLISNKVGKAQPTKVFFDKDQMKAVPLHKRTTIRDLACQLHISKSLVGRWVKFNVIRPHSNAIKPQLSFKNNLQRIECSLSQLQVEATAKTIIFSEMQNIVHIDEKWFYMSKNSERYYMVPEEQDPHRTTQSKRFIQKVMFMCAVCRPRISYEGEVKFDGKIGIWPFTKQVPAIRNSVNRIRGTMETKPIDSITKEVIKDCLITQIIPAIKSKWPAGENKHIIIQQDNAKPHVLDDDPDFRAAATSDGFNIQLVCQPPNSPDCNINDLGWFRVIQSLQVETTSYSINQLVMNVMISYENLTAVKLNNVFLSLQSCLIEIMKVHGDNNYRLPHIGKGQLIRAGRLPNSLTVEKDVITDCIQFLLDSGNNEVWTYNFQGLLAALD